MLLTDSKSGERYLKMGVSGADKSPVEAEAVPPGLVGRHRKVYIQRERSGRTRFTLIYELSSDGSARYTEEEASRLGSVSDKGTLSKKGTWSLDDGILMISYVELKRNDEPWKTCDSGDVKMFKDEDLCDVSWFLKTYPAVR